PDPFGVAGSRIRRYGMGMWERPHGPSRAQLAIAMMTALGAGAAAILAQRRQARLLAHHTRLIELRATELEAFAGRVAHDLRNPLNAIMLRVESLRVRALVEPTFAEALDRLAAQTGR